MAIVGMLLHWLACALGMAAQLQGSLRTPELEAALASRLNAAAVEAALGSEAGDAVAAAIAAGDEENGACYGCIYSYTADNCKRQAARRGIGAALCHTIRAPLPLSL